MKKIIVIGAGILGASTAYHLAKMGAEVHIIDRQDKGQATEAAAGIVCPWLVGGQSEAWYTMANAGAGYFPTLIEELNREGEQEVGYQRAGALIIHHEESEIEKLEERARLREGYAREIGEISRLTEQISSTLFPLLSDGYHSVFVQGAAIVEGRLLRNSLLRIAERNGAVRISGDAELLFNGSQVTGTKVGSNCYMADMVIVCAGAWAEAIFKPMGLTFNVNFEKAQTIHLKLPGAKGMEKWPAVIDPSTQYIVPLDGGRVVVGSTTENDSDRYDARLTARGVHKNLTDGLEIAPGLADGIFLGGKVGFRPFTAGGVPVAGNIPGWKGVIAANGLGATGLTIGPFLGLQLAKLALDMELDINLSEYDIRNAIAEEK
ncbi:oxidoreductase [Bacillus sp. FJAT-18017]|uniref:NAD(P)/FAD-dependent oxidoreductase n=1 Tax=Bacillus sp. FJAT-18017 TaxID=1705566 RepID=UPI0006AEDE52|nr:FAD-binding oxidoreductase [Bacillus sp. FJAT-18017]ALC88968.1 oxidoreductase [Bacillus sp. FJAT-18017]